MAPSKYFGLVFIILILSSLPLSGQDISVEKAVYNVQLGAIGLWGNGEFRLSNKIALRTELGFAAAYSAGGFTGAVRRDIVAAYNLIIEPRWYYNLAKRANVNKKTENNTADYLSLKVSYITGKELFSTSEFLQIAETLMVGPTWGLRRHIGSNINYELGLGVGLLLDPSSTTRFTSIEPDINIRIGYSF